jgi:hypothetical protein
VLRAENRGERHSFAPRHAVDDVQKPTVDRRVIADHTDAGAFEAVRAEKNVGSEADGDGHPLKK